MLIRRLMSFDGSSLRPAHGWLGRSAATALVTALAVTSARAEPLSLVVVQDPVVQSSFTLDFGANGGNTTAFIATTQYKITVDPVAGTAAFDAYYQHVDPLALPDGQGGQVSTGNMLIAVVPGSSSGTYDAATGVFTTHEDYAIYFEGDLSALGITSPVVLPSDSTGTIQLNRALPGTVHLEWGGSSTIGGPGGVGDPNGLAFSYTCTVNTILIPNPIDGDLNSDALVDGTDVNIFRALFGTMHGDSAFDPFGDLDNNGVIDCADWNLMRPAVENPLRRIFGPCDIGARSLTP